jgi:hypothetical protein
MAKLVKIDEFGKVRSVPDWFAAAGEVEALADLWDLQSRREDDPIEIGVVRRYIRKGNLRKARELLDALPPTNASLVNLSGVVYELEGQYDLAFECYVLAFKLDPELGAALFNVERLSTIDSEIDDRICL